MLKIFSTITSMIVTISLATVAFAQCNSCGGTANFSYPGGTCATCSTGGQGVVGVNGRHQHGEYLKAKLDHAVAYDAKVSARNRAWPKPFNCADRQAYAAIWGPMLDAGFADQTTITATHFEDGKLTRYGKQQIAGILRNMPQHRKVVYVQRDADEETTLERYNQVQEVVTTFFGQSGRVALTDRNPLNQQGLRAEATTNAYFGSLPVPIIPIASGTTSVNQSVSN